MEMRKQIQIILFLLTIGFGLPIGVNAQTGNFGTGYFQNQYVLNPAMAGLNSKEFNINTAYNKESTAVSNSAKTIYITADYGLSNAVGLGVNLIMDNIGALSTTRIMGTYAYQVKLNEDNQSLHFGVSVGGVKERFNANDISGDPSDVFLYNFNDRKMQFEADFGVAYLRDRLTLQATAPNFVSTLRDTEKTILSQGTFVASAAYKISIADGGDPINLEPKIAFRSFKGLKSIIDAGANVDFVQNTINLFALYHSNKSVTAGIGFKVLGAFQVSGAYNSGSDNFSGGTIGNSFELGLRFYTKGNK
jgi:type IX secretion system PorP/SprF family membrane protein